MSFIAPKVLKFRSIMMLHRSGQLLNRERLDIDAGFDISYNDLVPLHYTVRFNRGDEDVTTLVPFTSVKSAILLEESLPKHQPVGTPDTHDTPSGRKKQYRLKKPGEYDFPKTPPLKPQPKRNPPDPEVDEPSS